MTTPWPLLLIPILIASSARAEAPTFDTVLGLRRGATADDVYALLHEPYRVEPSFDPVMRYAVVPSDPARRPTLDITIERYTGRVSKLALDLEARDGFMRREPLFSLLGSTRADVIASLGVPSVERILSPEWHSTTPDLPGESRLTVDFGSDGRAQKLSVVWHTPTLYPRGRPRLADFGRFAGLARGDREDRVIAVLGAPTNINVDSSRNLRTLVYPGLFVLVDRATGLITTIEFGAKAQDFLATRGIDEPNLWVLGKSPWYLAKKLGRPISKDDPESWLWPSARQPHGRLRMWCGERVVPRCFAAYLDWLTPLAPLPKMRVSDFERLGPLKHGDTEVELRQKLGEPTRVSPGKLGDGQFFHYGDDELKVHVNWSGRIDMLFVSAGTGPWLASRGMADPRLAIVGRKRSEWVRALGRPESEDNTQSPSWTTPYTASRKVSLRAACFEARAFACDEVNVSW